MAAAFTTTASALSAPNALSSRGGAAGLSSGKAFQTTSIVQQGPVSSRAHRMVVARASLGAKESKAAARREVLASILAAGAALGFGGGAVADTVQDAKSQAGEIFKGSTKVQQSFGNLGLRTEFRGAGSGVASEEGKTAGSASKASEDAGPGPGIKTEFRGLGTGVLSESGKAAGSAADSSPSLSNSSKQSDGGDLVGQAKDTAPSLPNFPKPELPKVDLPSLPKVDLPKFN